MSKFRPSGILQAEQPEHPYLSYLSLISHELIKHLQEVRSRNAELAVLVVNQVSVYSVDGFSTVQDSLITYSLYW